MRLGDEAGFKVGTDEDEAGFKVGTDEDDKDRLL
jgi:hypothetical protein